MNSMVGQDAVFQGDIKLDEGIIVYGTVYGNIHTQGAVRVSRTGKVHGDITGSDIHIGGHVEGNVVVENRAVLGEASLLNGNLTYKSLIIEEGAQFQGQCIIPVSFIQLMLAVSGLVESAGVSRFLKKKSRQ